MINRELKYEVSRYKPFAFWGFSIAITSILYASYHLLHDGLLFSVFEDPFKGIPEDVISWLLFGFGVFKVIGVITDNKKLMKIGIIGLSGIWGMLMLLATTYSFGTGYPTARFITTGFIVLACLRVSYKGDFG